MYCTFFGNVGYFVFRNLRICEYCIYYTLKYRVSRLGGVSDGQCLL